MSKYMATNLYMAFQYLSNREIGEAGMVSAEFLKVAKKVLFYRNVNLDGTRCSAKCFKKISISDVCWYCDDMLCSDHDEGIFTCDAPSCSSKLCMTCAYDNKCCDCSKPLCPLHNPNPICKRCTYLVCEFCKLYKDGIKENGIWSCAYCYFWI
jgi:hypothetical protein